MIVQIVIQLISEKIPRPGFIAATFICQMVLLYSIYDDIDFWLNFIDSESIKLIPESHVAVIYFSGYISGVLRTLILAMCFLGMLDMIRDKLKPGFIKLVSSLAALVVLIGALVSLVLIFV